MNDKPDSRYYRPTPIRITVIAEWGEGITAHVIDDPAGYAFSVEHDAPHWQPWGEELQPGPPRLTLEATARRDGYTVHEGQAEVSSVVRRYIQEPEEPE